MNWLRRVVRWVSELAEDGVRAHTLREPETFEEWEARRKATRH